MKLTRPQLQVLYKLLSMVLNDPDGWEPAMGRRNWATLGRAYDAIQAELFKD